MHDHTPPYTQMGTMPDSIAEGAGPARACPLCLRKVGGTHIVKKVLKVVGIVLVAVVLVGAGALLLMRPDPDAAADEGAATAVAPGAASKRPVSATGNVVADNQAIAGL